MLRVSVINLGRVEIRVGYALKNLVVIDGSIKGITQWVFVDIFSPRANFWVVVILRVLSVVLGTNIGTNKHVELTIKPVDSTFG